jgi:hypothetical protein
VFVVWDYREIEMDFKKLAGKNWKGVEGIDYYSDGDEYMVWLKDGWEQEGYGATSFVIGDDDDDDMVAYQFSLIQRVA